MEDHKTARTSNLQGNSVQHNSIQDSKNSALSTVLVTLLKGVLYQDSAPEKWSQLLNLQARVRDYIAMLGLDLILDEAEGYAFLRSRFEEEGDADNQSTENISNQNTPRLIARRPLSFPVSLLLALLRKKLAEFDASGEETRLVLSRDELIDLIRVFLPDSSNEAKLVDQVDRHINKVKELGFLQRLKSNSNTQQAHFEVRRIIKSFVDAQWLSEFDQQLEQYQQHLKSTDNDKTE